MMSADGIVIRIAVADISTFARPAKGVRVMRFKKETDMVLQLALVQHDDEVETELPDAPDADSSEGQTEEEKAQEKEAETEEPEDTPEE